MKKIGYRGFISVAGKFLLVFSFLNFALVSINNASAEEEKTENDSALSCLNFNLKRDGREIYSAKIISHTWKDIKFDKNEKKDDDGIDIWKGFKELNIVYEVKDEEGNSKIENDFCVMNPTIFSERFEVLTVIRKMDNKLKEINSKLSRTKKYGIGIRGANIYDESEYTDGTGFQILYYNPTKKTIKYISTTVVGINQVKDIVKDIYGKSQITVKGVGPIEPGDSAKYKYDYTWDSD